MAIISTIGRGLGTLTKAVGLGVVGNAAANAGEKILHGLFGPGQTQSGGGQFEMQAATPVDKPRLVDQVGGPISAEGMSEARAHGIQAATGEVGEPAVRVSGEDLVHSLEILHGHIIKTMQQIDKNSIARYEETSKRLDRTEDHIIALSDSTIRMQKDITGLNSLYLELNRRFSHLENKQKSINLSPGGSTQLNNGSDSGSQKKDDENSPGWLASLGEDAFEGWLFSRIFKGRGAKVIEAAAAKKIAEAEAKKLASHEGEKLAAKEAERVVARDAEKIVGKGLGTVAKGVVKRTAPRAALAALGLELGPIGWIMDAGLAAWTAYDVIKAVIDYSGGMSNLMSEVTNTVSSLAKSTAGVVESAVGGVENAANAVTDKLKSNANVSSARASTMGGDTPTWNQRGGQGEFDQYGPGEGHYNPKDLLTGMAAITGAVQPHLPGQPSNLSMVPGGSTPTEVGATPITPGTGGSQPGTGGPRGQRQGMWNAKQGETQVPGFSGYTADQLPKAQTTNKFIADRRAQFAEQLKDPQTRLQVAAMMQLEGGGKGPYAVGDLESLMNRASFSHMSLLQMLHSGFYGPIKHGMLPGAMAQLQRDPKKMAEINATMAQVLAGSDTIKGHTDQGMITDPGGMWESQHGATMIHKEVFGDWLTSWKNQQGKGFGSSSIAWREEFERKAAQAAGDNTPPEPTSTQAAPPPSAVAPVTKSATSGPSPYRKSTVGPDTATWTPKGGPSSARPSTMGGPTSQTPAAPTSPVGEPVTGSHSWQWDAAKRKRTQQAEAQGQPPMEPGLGHPDIEGLEGARQAIGGAMWKGIGAVSSLGRFMTKSYDFVTARHFKGANWLQRQEAQNAEYNAEAADLRGINQTQQSSSTQVTQPPAENTIAASRGAVARMRANARRTEDQAWGDMSPAASGTRSQPMGPPTHRADPEDTHDAKIKALTGTAPNKDPVHLPPHTAHPEDQPDGIGDRGYGPQMDQDRIGICSV